MHHAPHISPHAPRLAGQSEGHRRRLSLQRGVRTHPIVKIPPQPQRPLQCRRQPRSAAAAAKKLRLLIAHRAVETFHMGGVDLVADLQSADQPLDFLFASEQRPRFHAQEFARRIADFFHHAHPQCRRRLEGGIIESAPPPLATAMTHQAEHLQNGVGIGQMVVDQQQQGTKQNSRDATEHRHGCRQLRRHLQRARTDSKVDQKPRLHRQSRVNPVSTQSATASRMPPPILERFGLPFFAPFFQTRPCSSSSSTASMGSCNRSNCWWWKSSARLPARSSIRWTLRGSTAQMSAVASIEQPCPRHLMIRTTSASGSLVYCMSEPCRSLKRCWQWLQYKRRMDLSLPIRSTTQRFPASNWLKRSQSELGQANIAKSSASSLTRLVLDIRGLHANTTAILPDSSKSRDRNAQNNPLWLPTS